MQCSQRVDVPTVGVCDAKKGDCVLWLSSEVKGSSTKVEVEGFMGVPEACYESPFVRFALS